MNSRVLDVCKLGTVPYLEALNLQKKFHMQIFNKERNSTLILLEHPPVITLGKHASFEDVLESLEDLNLQNISVEQIDRGGEATAHEPGQLVIYPLLDLRSFGLGPKAFVHKLEEVIIDLLAAYSIQGTRDEKFPGVWVGSEKICSLGIRISKGISYHGAALNISNTLDTFTKIIPCGIRDRSLVTMSRLLDRDLPLSEAADVFLKIFSSKFEVATRFVKD
jgi:lipoate-protein ligase B